LAVIISKKKKGKSIFVTFKVCIIFLPQITESGCGYLHITPFVMIVYYCVYVKFYTACQVYFPD